MIYIYIINIIIIIIIIIVVVIVVIIILGALNYNPVKMGEDHPRIYRGNKPYFDHSSYVVNPKRWEDAVDDTHEVYKPKDPSYNNISIWLQLSVQLSVFATWTRISRSLPWLSFIGIIVIISWMDIYIYIILCILYSSEFGYSLTGLFSKRDHRNPSFLINRPVGKGRL